MGYKEVKGGPDHEVVISVMQAGQKRIYHQIGPVWIVEVQEGLQLVASVALVFLLVETLLAVRALETLAAVGHQDLLVLLFNPSPLG